MSKEEKSKYYFQQWWAQNGQEVLYWFGPDGKYASTEIRFYPGMAPDKGSPGGVKNSMRKTYSGLTTFGEKGWSQKEMYYGETEVAISELPKLEKTQINVYVNLKYAQTNTAEHEWKHVKIIFNCVQDQKQVPSGGNSDGSEPNTQHWLINNGKVPSFK